MEKIFSTQTELQEVDAKLRNKLNNYYNIEKTLIASEVLIKGSQTSITDTKFLEYLNKSNLAIFSLSELKGGVNYLLANINPDVSGILYLASGFPPYYEEIKYTTLDLPQKIEMNFENVSSIVVPVDGTTATLIAVTKRVLTEKDMVKYSKNLIGSDEHNGYLVDIKPGEQFVFSTRYGESLPEKAVLYGLKAVNTDPPLVLEIEAGISAQVFSNTSDTAIKYLSWWIAPTVACQVEKGNIPTEYEECHRVGVVLEDYIYLLRDSLVGEINNNWRTGEANSAAIEELKTDKQDTLVNGTNIKTINGESILGSGDIEIKGGEGSTQLIKGDYYSEEETCIGRYINGKPIYRKMLNGTNDRNVDVRDLNIDNLIFADIVCSNSSDNVKILLSSTTTSSHFRELWFEDGYIKYFMDNSVIVRKIILEYTKTTDTAETPIPESVLPTSLIKGETYSTEEQCIGRYADGKPVYQKTYMGIGLNNGDTYLEQNMPYDITIIDASGYATEGSGTVRVFPGFGNMNMHCAYNPATKIVYFTVGVAFGGKWGVTLKYTKATDTASTPIQTSILNSDEIQAMIDASIGSVLGGEF